MEASSVGTDTERRFLFSGDPLLRPAVAVEKLGGGQDRRPHDGPRPGDHLRGGEEAEEEAPRRLPLLQLEEPQLLDVQILLLRAPLPSQRDR